jgi:ABC-type glycerol-3-phosphate transport system permease component
MADGRGLAPPADRAGDQPYNTVLGIGALITLVPTAVFFVAQRYFIQGVVISGSKG